MASSGSVKVQKPAPEFKGTAVVNGEFKGKNEPNATISLTGYLLTAPFFLLFVF